MNDQVAGWLCLLLGSGTGAYTFYAWKKGRINFKGVSIRAKDPVGFWTSIIIASFWSACTIGAGIYALLR